jgi:putative isomerase
MFTGFLPLWCGIADNEQAAALLRHANNPGTFAARHGIRSLSKREPMFSLAASGNPSNWLGPVWILANYLVWQGLRRYGFHDEAGILADKTVRLLADDVAANGATHEYYHPDTGAPIPSPVSPSAKWAKSWTTFENLPISFPVEDARSSG